MHIVKTLRQANADIWILWASVFIRMLGFGLTNQVLVLFLQAVNISESNIGDFMTLTLIGDVIISYILSWNADKIGRRVVLLSGAIMMLVSGLVFCYQSEFLYLLIAAVVGVISPSGDETGPFKTIEEASMAHLTPQSHLPEVFAFYGLFATFGNALGSLLGGLLVDYLNLSLHWDLISCYRSIFAVYTFLAVLKFLLMSSLSPKCEAYYKVPYDDGDHDETTPLTEPIAEPERNTDSGLDVGSTVSVASKLLVVFFLDSFGYGFMPASWTIYYFKETYHITATLVGTLYFITNIINTFSSLPSAVLAKVLGPVKAIIVTQAPSCIFFMLIALSNNFIVSAALLVLYYATTTMDVVPRQVLLTSVVKRDVLTKVMGTVNTVKTLARSVGPIFTGRLAESNNLRLGFVITGTCTLLSDVVLGYNFLSLDPKILRKQRINQDII